MALPKKGTRKLTVDGVVYRYIGMGWRGEGEDFCELIVELAEMPRQKLKAAYTFTRVQKAYRAAGHSLSHVLDAIPPYVARQTILIGLERGWNPHAGGGLLNLGNLDSVIDFSNLNAHAQDPGKA